MRTVVLLLNRSLVLTAAVTAAACASARVAPQAPAAPVPPSSSPSTPNVSTSVPSSGRQALLDVCRLAHDHPTRRADPHEDLDAILWQQTSAEYRANTTTVYRAASAALKGLVGDSPAGNEVVVFDLDETVLDNSAFQGRLLAEGRNYDSPLWDCWVGQEQALRIAGAELLFREMVRQGVPGRFVTNRKCRVRPGDGDACPQEAETLANLNALLKDTGYVATPAELLLSGEKNPTNGEVWDDEKKPRRDFISGTHRIVMLVGDDLGDFVEGVRKTTIARRAEELARTTDRWGSSWFQLPNPSYGSWVTAVDQEAAGKRHELVDAFPYPKE